MKTKFYRITIPSLSIVFCFIFLAARVDKLKSQTKSQDMNNRTSDTNRIIDLSGTWLMKDFTCGIGLQKKVYLPGMEPRDCLPCDVPGTVRTALLKAGEIPDPYIGFDNEKSLWVEQKECGSLRNFPLMKTSKENS